MKENKEIVEILFTGPGTPLFIFSRGCASPRCYTRFFPFLLHNTPTAPILTTSGLLLSVPIFPGYIRLLSPDPWARLQPSAQIRYIYTLF